MINKILKVRMIIQPTVSHYRAPLIRELLRSKDIEFDLFGRFQNTDEKTSMNRIRSAEDSLLASVNHLKTRNWGPLRWESGIVKSVLDRQYDAHVLEGRVYNLSTWVALIVARVLNRKVLLWGHGWKREERGIKLLFRRQFYGLAAGLLLYGENAKRIAENVGLPSSQLTVVHNSIYSREEISSLGSDQVNATTAYGSIGLDDKASTLIVSCRLTPRHKIELLAQALGVLHMSGPYMNVIVVGDGSQREVIENAFHRVACQALFVGEVYSVSQLGGLYEMADLAVSPAASGLNIVQAMGFGVPVLVPLNDPHAGPEEELVVEGLTGARFEYGNPEDLSLAIIRILENEAQRKQMGINGREVVLSKYTAEAHAEAFVNAIKKSVR